MSNVLFVEVEGFVFGNGQYLVVMVGVYVMFFQIILNGIVFVGVGFFQCVVMVVSVGDDGQYGMVEIGDQLGVGGEIYIVLFMNGIYCVVVFGDVIGVIKQCVGCLVVFQIQNMECLIGFNCF